MVKMRSQGKQGRRQQEDEEPVRAALHDVERALRIDLQEDVLSGLAALLDLAERVLHSFDQPCRSEIRAGKPS